MFCYPWPVQELHSVFPPRVAREGEQHDAGDVGRVRMIETAAFRKADTHECTAIINTVAVRQRAEHQPAIASRADTSAPTHHVAVRAADRADCPGTDGTNPR